MVWPLLTSYKYIERNYQIPEEQVGDNYLFFHRNSQILLVEMPTENVGKLIWAYNQDVTEKPDVVLEGQGRLLVNVELVLGIEQEQEGYLYERRYALDIYDTMEHFIEALVQMGYGEMTAEIQAEDIQEIRLRYSGGLDQYGNSVLSAMDGIRDYFGLERVGMENVIGMEDVPEDEDTMTAMQDEELPVATAAYGVYRENPEGLEIAVTDQAGIQELAKMLSYEPVNSYRGIFQSGFLGVTVTDKVLGAILGWECCQRNIS